MKKRRLKGFVLPGIYLLTMTAIFIGIFFTTKDLFSGERNYTYTVDSVSKENVPVVSTVDTEESVIEPIKENKATISTYFYNKDVDEERQQSSLISYESTYFKSTGIMYESEEEFDVLSVLDGKVVDIKEDDILGMVIEVECAKNIKAIYSSLKTSMVKIGDTVKQGDIIGLSGSNKLNESKNNNLYFEVYYNGNLIDPLEFFELNINEL